MSGRRVQRTGAGLERERRGPRRNFERRCGALEDEVREAISDRDASTDSRRID
jgi:hypothetical protein